MKSRLLATLLAAVLLPILLGCSESPDTAGNATIHLVGALQDRDEPRVRTLLCDDAASSLDSNAEGGSLSSRLERVGNLGSGCGTTSQFEEDADTMGDDITVAWTDYEGLDGELPMEAVSRIVQSGWTFQWGWRIELTSGEFIELWGPGVGALLAQWLEGSRNETLVFREGRRLVWSL